MVKLQFFSILLGLLMLMNGLNAQECSWDGELCVTYCTGIYEWEYGGTTNYDLNTGRTICFDPTDHTLSNPLEILRCYDENDPSAWRHADYRHTFCFPEGICAGSLTRYRVNEETGLQLMDDINNIQLEARPHAGCAGFCENMDLQRREVFNDGEKGLYKINYSFDCCDENGNYIETINGEFYYKIIDGVSEIEVDLQFTASEQIENINGDNIINGVIPATGTPELGLSSAGVRLTNGGGGVFEYTVTIYEIDCTDPSVKTQIATETIAFNYHNEIIDFSFLNFEDGNGSYIFDIPNVEDNCYEVEITVESECGVYTENAFFTFTDQCSFCLTAGNNTGSEQVINNSIEKLFSISPNPSSTGTIIQIESETKIYEYYIIDSRGVVISKFYASNKDCGNRKMDLIAPPPGVYYIFLNAEENGFRPKKFIVHQ